MASSNNPSEKDNAVSNQEQLEYEFDVTYDEAPVPPGRAGRRSKWDTLVAAARDVATKAAKEKRRAPDGGAPWIFYPKDKKPVVGVQNLSNLRKRFGPNSDHAKNNNGEFFEFEIDNRVQSGQGNTSQSGVLWVRRGTAKK